MKQFVNERITTDLFEFEPIKYYVDVFVVLRYECTVLVKNEKPKDPSSRFMRELAA